MVREARAADIIVVGEADGAALGDPFGQIGAGDLVMQAGRPLLVVPDTCNWLDLRSVLIAWKDTAEARRAVADALPMLRKATDVTVVEIVEEQADRAVAVSRVRDVVAWLSRHGVNASERVPDQYGEAGEALGAKCLGNWRRPGRCGRLWTFAASRMDPWRGNAAPYQSLKSLFITVALIDLHQHRPDRA
jgi:hypothetical protein